MSFTNTKGKWILDCLLPLALAALLPLSLLHSEIFLINNYFVTVALLFLLMLVCVWKIVAKTSIKITPLDILLASVFIISILSSLVNKVSFNATFNIKFVLYAALFLLMKDTLNYKKAVICFFLSVIVTNLYITGVATMLWATQGNYLHFIVDRFANTGIFAIYLSVSSVFLLNIIKENYKRKWYYTLLLLVAANIGFILLLQSRVAVLLIIVYLAYTYLPLLPRLKRMTAKTRITSTVIITIFALLFLALYTKRDSTEGRFLILQISSRIVSDHPLIGAGGFGSFAVTYPLYQAEHFSSGDRPEREVMLADNMQIALNEPVQFATEVGLLGLALILLMVYRLIKRLKINNTLRITFIAILFVSCFSYILRIKVFQNLAFILLMIAGIREKPLIQMKSKIALFVICPILIASVLSVNCLTSKYIDSLIVRHQIERGINLDNKSELIMERFQDNPTILFAYGRQLFNRGNHERSLEVLHALTQLLHHSQIESLKARIYRFMGKYDKAEKHFTRASNICPNRFEYRYELFLLHLERGYLDRAIQVALGIRDLREKVPSPFTLAVRLEIERFLEENNIE